MKLENPEIRYLNDIKTVLYDKEWAKNAPNFELYYIYRGLKEKNGIRYDITVIPPKMLGKEFVKTKGHYHFGSYGELYKILAGESIFLIQKKGVKDVYFVKAKKGEYILISPQYGHTIINPSSKTESPPPEKGTKVKKRTKSSSPLKIANWASKDCQSDYKSIERKRGFCYYYTKSGWVKNKAYKKIPKLRLKRPLKKFPKNLNFLYG
jgi:glucose-6-phosphate isomerase